MQRRGNDVFMSDIGDGSWRGALSRSLRTTRQPPALFLFYHVEKTGGTSVKAWLKRLVREGRQPGSGGSQSGLPRRLDAVLDYTLAKCFICAQFGIGVSAAGIVDCGDPSKLSKETRRRRTEWYCPSSEREFIAKTDPGEKRQDALVEALAPLFASALDRPKSTNGQRGRRGMGTVSPTVDADELGVHSRLRIAVEFHASSKAFFLSRLLPVIDQLRAHYASINGTFVTGTLVRAPLAHVYSALHMWPPHRPPRDKVARDKMELAIPLERYFRCAAAAQSGLLTARAVPESSNPAAQVRPAPRLAATGGRSAATSMRAGRSTRLVNTVFQPGELGMRNDVGCSAVEEARKNLARFDFVGTTDCAVDFERAVYARLGFPAESAEVQRRRFAHPRNSSALLHVRPSNGVQKASPLAAQMHAWDWSDSLNASARLLVLAAVDCDTPLYLAAVQRSSAQLGCPAVGEGARYAAFVKNSLSRAIAESRSDLTAYSDGLRRQLNANNEPSPRGRAYKC